MRSVHCETGNTFHEAQEAHLCEIRGASVRTKADISHSYFIADELEKNITCPDTGRPYVFI
jgi:hypothetical protein